jgi:hypothetical protein
MAPAEGTPIGAQCSFVLLAIMNLVHGVHDVVCMFHSLCLCMNSIWRDCMGRCMETKTVVVANHAFNPPNSANVEVAMEMFFMVNDGLFQG